MNVGARPPAVGRAEVVGVPCLSQEVPVAPVVGPGVMGVRDAPPVAEAESSDGRRPIPLVVGSLTHTVLPPNGVVARPRVGGQVGPVLRHPITP